MSMTNEFKEAYENHLDTWVPACGGTEQPFLMNGVRWLYVFNPVQMKHAYLNLDTDLIEDNPFGVFGVTLK